MSMNKSDWLSETEHKKMLARATSIHPWNDRRDANHSTSKRVDKAVLSRKIAAVEAHIARHPRSLPPTTHLAKLLAKL